MLPGECGQWLETELSRTRAPATRVHVLSHPPHILSEMLKEGELGVKAD